MTGGFLASPYFPVDPSSNTSFHFAPELCYYTQTTFGVSDIGLDPAAAAALYGALTFNCTTRSGSLGRKRTGIRLLDSVAGRLTCFITVCGAAQARQ